ncbi:hypothetical protein ACN6K6_007461 [Streptomyces violaceoruber]|uniref:hypothetical protein n=1 Tax=Streptomyces violaceoruber TaxID=1935 RepID=UPI00403D122D
MIRERDKRFVAEFTDIVGEVLQAAPGGMTPAGTLFGACVDEARRRGSDFIPMGTFVRLLKETGYREPRHALGVVGIRVRSDRR